MREGGRPLLDNVKDYLRDKKLLLVLDNFEQLVSAAPVVADLLAAAPQLKIITSSRIALKFRASVISRPALGDCRDAKCRSTN